MSAFRLQTSLETMLSCLAEKKNRRDHQQKYYDDIHRKLVNTATTKVIRNIGSFVKHLNIGLQTTSDSRTII